MQHSFAVLREYKCTTAKGFDRRDGVNSSSNSGRVVVVVVALVVVVVLIVVTVFVVDGRFCVEVGKCVMQRNMLLCGH
jgi:anti-sigma-K factor RskA